MAEKAIIAEIDYGFIQVEGLCHPTEGYGIAIAQANRFMNFVTNPTHAVRTVKRLLGRDCEITQWKTDYTNTKVKILNLKDFSLLCVLLMKRGNATAESFVLAAIEETHERRFDTAFGKVVEEAEYNERMKLRLKRLSARHDWTDTLMHRFVDLYGKKPTRNHYKIWTTEVNLALFHRPNFNSNRDNMSLEQQEIITDFERTAKRMAKKYPKAPPNTLIRKALDTF